MFSDMSKHQSIRSTGSNQSAIAKKLGISPGCKLCILQAPDHYTASIGPMSEEITIFHELTHSLDIIHLFVHSQDEILQVFSDLPSAIHRDGMIWISWPKKSSGVSADLDRDWIRAYVLDQGLVDVKVASFDAVYSALKFVYRLKDRKRST